MNSIDKYIAGFPDKTQEQLKKMRAIIRKVAPEAEEEIKYGIPTFILNGNLVHYGGFKNHIGFYPAPSGIAEFKEELSKYKGAKGSIQFPLEKALPASLITKIVKHRLKENLLKAESKKKLKLCPNGHTFYKSSDCPVCPICESERTTQNNFLDLLAAPARRALENNGIRTLKQLSKFREENILSLHGIGKSSIPILRKALKAGKLDFKK